MARAKREPKHGLTFQEKRHVYYLDGKHVPGVTTIIGVLEKPGISRWAAETVARYVVENPDDLDVLMHLGDEGAVNALKGIPWKRRDDAADRGHKFHYYAQELLLGNVIDVPDEQVDLVNSALDFMEDFGIEPVAVEAAVGSREHRYAGTADLVADCTRGPRAGQRGLFDWKSGKRIYAGAVFQLNAYGHAEFTGLDGDEKPVADWGIEAAYGVHIREDGYSVHPLEYGPKVFEEFLVVRAAYDINKRAEGDYKVPGTGYVGVPIIIDADEDEI